jgi:hypothetical protein
MKNSNMHQHSSSNPILHFTIIATMPAASRYKPQPQPKPKMINKEKLSLKLASTYM